MAIIQDIYQLETAQFQEQIRKVQAGYEGTAKGADKAATEGKKFGSETAKGAKQADTELKKVEKQTGSLSGSLKKLSVAVAAAFAVKKVYEFLKASVEAADVQLQAEAKLRQALKGREDIMARLTARASELQKATGIGDEAIIQQQAFLAAQGRSEDQINRTLDAAVQLAAVTGTDLGSAIQTLDATLEGNIGRLGKLDAGMKELTAEQLKNGAAVDLIAEKYAGFAEKQAKTGTGAIIQAKNAFGDMQEEIGKKLIPVLASLARGFMFLLDNIKVIISTFKVAAAGIGAYVAVTKGAAIAKKAYTAAVKLADLATKGFNKTVKSSPIGLIVAGIAAAGVAISEYVKRTKEAADANSELTKSIEEVQNAGQKEITQANLIFERLKKTTEGSRERANILKQINSTYGLTLKNMKSEKEFLEQISAAQDQVIKGLKEKIVLRIQETKYEDVLTRQIKAQQNLAIAEQKLLDLQQKKLLATDLNAVAMNQLNIQIATAEGEISMLKSAISRTETEMKDLDAETKNLTQSFSNLLGGDNDDIPEKVRQFDLLKQRISEIQAQIEDEAVAGFINPETVASLKEAQAELDKINKLIADSLGLQTESEEDALDDGYEAYLENLAKKLQAEEDFQRKRAAYLSKYYLPTLEEEFDKEQQALVDAIANKLITEEEGYEILAKMDAEYRAKKAKAEEDAAAEMLASMNKSIGLASQGIRDILTAIGDEQSEFADFTKALALFDIAMSQAISIANAIQGATAAAKAGGAAAPFLLAGYIASMIGTVVAGFAQASQLVSNEPPRFFEGTPSVPLAGNPKGRDTVPAYLNEGEAVIPTDANRAYPGLAEAWIGGDLDRYIHKNWIAPTVKAAERERAERELNAIGQMLVQGFDDYRLHKDNREMIGVMRSGFAQLREGRKKVRGRV